MHTRFTIVVSTAKLEAVILLEAFYRGVDKFVGVGGLGWKVCTRSAREIFGVSAHEVRAIFFFSVKAHVIF